jgi:hypothetical protein
LSLIATHGIEAATECAEFEAKNLPAVKKVIEKEDIDCDFVFTRAVDALMSDTICDRMKSAVDLLRKNGVSVMQDVYFARGTEAEQVRRVEFRSNFMILTSTIIAVRSKRSQGLPFLHGGPHVPVQAHPPTAVQGC